MPQEIKGKINVKVDPRAIAKQPRLAARIGIISSLWAEIEDEIAFLFAVTMQTDLAIAAASLRNVFSLAVRLDMLRTIMSLRFPDEAVKRFDPLYKKIKARGKERSRIVHSLWTVHKGHPKALA